MSGDISRLREVRCFIYVGAAFEFQDLREIFPPWQLVWLGCDKHNPDKTLPNILGQWEESRRNTFWGCTQEYTRPRDPYSTRAPTSFEVTPTSPTRTKFVLNFFIELPEIRIHGSTRSNSIDIQKPSKMAKVSNNDTNLVSCASSGLHETLTNDATSRTLVDDRFAH